VGQLWGLNVILAVLDTELEPNTWAAGCQTISVRPIVSSPLAGAFSVALD
jgi:hypothetical protein